MTRWLLFVALIASGQTAAPPRPIDVSTLAVGAPTVVAQIDLGRLKGEFRQLAWSPDRSQFYIQTTDSDRPDATVHHYLLDASGGAVTDAPRQPDWAADYWRFKSDRSAPGLPSLMIDVDRKLETMKVGTGSAGAADGGDRAGGGTVMSANNIDREAQAQKESVVRLMLLDEAVGEFVNQPVIPGLTFSWGPAGSGAIAYTDRDGRLTFLDQQRRKQIVPGAKGALLPAWTTDGSRLAFLEKTGRKKFALMTATVGPR
jgi:hypothetical protein